MEYVAGHLHICLQHISACLNKVECFAARLLSQLTQKQTAKKICSKQMILIWLLLLLEEAKINILTVQQKQRENLKQKKTKGCKLTDKCLEPYQILKVFPHRVYIIANIKDVKNVLCQSNYIVVAHLTILARSPVMVIKHLVILARTSRVNHIRMKSWSHKKKKTRLNVGKR